jgi:hypothetical protein
MRRQVIRVMRMRHVLVAIVILSSATTGRPQASRSARSAPCRAITWAQLQLYLSADIEARPPTYIVTQRDGASRGPSHPASRNRHSTTLTMESDSRPMITIRDANETRDTSRGPSPGRRVVSPAREDLT